MQQYMKKNYIKTYLDNNGFDNECVNDLSNKEVDELYDLYHNNIVTPNTKLYGYYGTYYQIKKEYEQMVKYDILAFEKNHDDEGPLERLYEYWSEHTANYDLITKVCHILQQTHSKQYDRFNHLRKYCVPKQIMIQQKPIVKKQHIQPPHNIQQNDDMPTQIINAINQAIQHNDQTRISELYDVCTTDQEKTSYLSKVFSIKDFKPSKEMLKDVMRLEFDTNASLEVRLVKAVFSGSKI